ncbi:MAG: tRNA lysidine(34) synthetase TilS [Alphaproteobacteria bacterium]|nr:MAG: tRNA lysidine(34) synthetase TilS [Alphaproteobacteria bacterium]
MTEASPLLQQEFSNLFDALGPFAAKPIIAVAVSGGADSMALCLLAQEWAAQKGGKAIAITVDHGLRAESANEATQVHNWLALRGIEHHILRWEKEKNPAGNIQEQAREARFQLLTDFCKQKQIADLCLGHHQGDVAENFLIRLSRGSGVYGLAAMTAVSHRDGIRILRPLLDIPKSRLIAALKTLGQAWIEDPSNDNEDFLRVQFRKHQALFDSLGLTAHRLVETAKNMLRAKDAIAVQVADAMAQCLKIHDFGYAEIDRQKLTQFPAEIGLRLLADVLTCIGGKDVTPRLDSLENLHQELITSDRKITKTLSGCIIETDSTISVYREFGLIDDKIPITAGQKSFLWDGRFCIEWSLNAVPHNLYIGQITEKGWANAVQFCPEMRASPVSYTARLGLPALWRQKTDRLDTATDELMAIPHLNYWKNAEISDLKPRMRLYFHPQHKIKP